jgi:SAM-dependent methyltransferase
MSDVQYDEFLSRIYDDAPYFGRARATEPELFNGFYFENIRDKSRRILEFGSATGMLTLPMATAGYTIDSVDISPAMQAIVSERLQAAEPAVAGRVRQFVADATTFVGDAPYDSIVMPEGILLSLGDRDLQLALLESCHGNLGKGGRIYTDFCQPRYKVVCAKTLREHTRFRTRNGDDYLLSITFRYDVHSQIETWDTVFAKQRAARDPETIELSVSFRYLYHSELVFMLERCGFKVIDINVDHARGVGFSVIAEKN